MQRALRHAVAIVALVACGNACSTMSLVKKFNSGLLDSAGDPCRDPKERRRAIAVQVISHEMMDGYFSQAKADGDVENWMLRAEHEAGLLVQAVHGEACTLGNNLGVACKEDEPARRTSGHTRARWLGQRWRGDLPPAAFCDGATLDEQVAARTADRIRFDAGAGRAVGSLTALAIEGLIDLADIQAAVPEAFDELRKYMTQRGWKRRFDRHTLGLVVEGGATTGLYSAGIVWTALNLIDACRRNADCTKAAPDLEFDLVSGTSTGAMISVATEGFNTAKTDDDRKKWLDNFIEWFTCLGVADLYCVRDGDATSLLKDQRGMVEFDGIENQLTQGIGGIDIFSNQSELVLNTVDFRTGSLFDLSDQNELHGSNTNVVQGAIASAVLPFIARPVARLPSDWDQTMRFTYLDGGIRAELPVLPLVRRGVERLLVAASSPSVTGETTPLKSALDIAIRYIDVSTGGVTESEIAHAQRHVESVRLAEIELCKAELNEELARFGGRDDKENVDRLTAFCESDWNAVCTAQDATARHKAIAERPSESSALDLTDASIFWTWGMRSFFRNDVEVEGLHGYSFDITKTRHLFMAGAEAARERCGEIATVLGIPLKMVERGDGVNTGQLYEACSRPVTHKCAPRDNATQLRTCKTPREPSFAGMCR